MRATDLAHLLAGQAEGVCQHLLPNGRREGHDWSVGSINGEAGGSLKVTLQGSKAGVWCDFAGNPDDRGDMIGLWMKVRGLTLSETCQAATEWLNLPPESDYVAPPKRKRAKAAKPTHAWWQELQATMRAGNHDDLRALADLRELPSTAGLELASSHGHLFFGDVHDGDELHPSWILTDASRRNAQARKMDGSMWEFGGKRKPAKGKTIWGCDPSWPIGLAGCDRAELALVEGGPDFLAAWHFIWMMGKAGAIGPIGMLGASNAFSDAALKELSNRTVWVFPHHDEAGATAARNWVEQLGEVGTVVHEYDFGPDGVKDLNELATAVNRAEDDTEVEEGVAV